MNNTDPYVEQLISQIGGSPNSQLLVGSSQNLVKASYPSQQQALTKNQQDSTKILQNSTNSYTNQKLVNHSQILSEQSKQAKGDLEILVATGKKKDFLGKQLTFNDLDYMSEKELLKYHRIYQSTLALKVNDTFGKITLKTYCTLSSWFLPLDDKEKLYDDLRKDYILMNELDKWTGWLSLKMGGLMAVASTTLITIGHIENPILPIINESGSTKSDGIKGE